MPSTRSKDIYNLYDLRRYVDRNNFSVIMDEANRKYNGLNSQQAQWRLLGDWDTPSDSKLWSQGHKTVPIMARASLLGTHSLKPMRNTSGWKFYTGSTPKMGHGYTISEDDMFLLRDARNNTGRDMRDLIYDNLLTNASSILGGIHNELTHMSFELASTGEIHEQSVDGVKYDFTFDFDQSQFINCNPMWFAADGTPNNSATVIQDILAIQKTLTSTYGRNVNAWMVNKDTLDAIVNHPAVLSAYIAWRPGLNPATTANFIPTNVEILNFLHDRGVWMFLPIDFKSVHEEDGKPVEDAPAFSPLYMVAFNANEKMFTIKCTNSIWADRQQYGGISASTMYSFVESRIAVLSTWHENPIHNTVEFELYAGPVFRNLRDYARVQIQATE